MFENYVKNALFLTFFLKQFFVFYKIVQNCLQIFDIFHNNQLKITTLLYIINVKSVKRHYTIYFK